MTAPTEALKSPAALDPAERDLRTKVLKAITIIAVIDLFLFLPLVYAVIAGDRGVSKAFGPIHGTGFLIEIALVAFGSYSKWWGWWYSAVTLITTGPPGALLGHAKAKREALGE
ncbi:MAG: hypothetical protein AAGC46_16550 [Solirubrobacteraceae bacterium]|nr:hypothetical protein [Patulibacter sp.]